MSPRYISSSYNVTFQNKTSKRRELQRTADIAMTGSFFFFFSFSPHCFLSWNLESVKTACIFTQSHSVYLPKQLVGEFHSQTATVFHLGSAIKSLQMQMLPERHAAWEVGATQRGLALPARGSLFPGGCARSVQWHGTGSVWRSSRVNSSTYNWGMLGFLHLGESGREESVRSNLTEMIFILMWKRNKRLNPEPSKDHWPLI